MRDREGVPRLSVGGPDFVKSVMAPMPWTRIMPTGGVEATESSLRPGSAPASSPAASAATSSPRPLLDAQRLRRRSRRRCATTVQLVKTIKADWPRSDDGDTTHGHAEDQAGRRVRSGTASSFGEVMLRFDPGFGRVRNARYVPGLGRRRRVQRRPRHAEVLGQARRRRHRAAEERPRLAGRGLHAAGRRGHVARDLARLRRPRAATRASV